MGTANGMYTKLEDQLDTLGENIKHVVEYIASAREHAGDVKKSTISSANAFFGRAGKTIKDHPIAAVGIAFAIGYGVMRWIRR